MINATFEKWVTENKGEDEAVFSAIQRGVELFEDSVAGIRQGSTEVNETERKVIFVIFTDMSVTAFIIYDDAIGIELITMMDMFVAFQAGQIKIDGMDYEQIRQQAAELDAEMEKMKGVTIN